MIEAFRLITCHCAHCFQFRSVVHWCKYTPFLSTHNRIKISKSLLSSSQTCCITLVKFKKLLAVPWFRPLVASFPPRRPGFDPRSCWICGGKCETEAGFLLVLRFPRQSSLHKLLSIYQSSHHRRYIIWIPIASLNNKGKKSGLGRNLPYPTWDWFQLPEFQHLGTWRLKTGIVCCKGNSLVNRFPPRWTRMQQ
jgi:hypothetical protein